ncbi:uncharacterized protein LOC115219895 [Argonauta hians]
MEIGNQNIRWSVTLSCWIILHSFYSYLTQLSIMTLPFPGKLSILPGISLLLTIAEMVILQIFIRLIVPKQTKTLLEAIVIGYFSHFSATFIENYLLSTSTASSSSSSAAISSYLLFLYSLLPILTLISVRLFLGIILPVVQVVTLLIVTVGALGISYYYNNYNNKHHSASLNYNDAICGAAMVVLFICRDIAVKHVYLETGIFKIHCNRKMITFLTASFLMVAILETFQQPLWKHAIIKFLLSSLLHGIYSVLVLTSLLKDHTNVTVSLFSMLSHFLIQVDGTNILQPFQNITLFLAVVTCVLGIIIYGILLHKYSEHTDTNVRPNDRCTYLEFTVFLAIITALFFYVLPPKVSSRDKNNLKYLGFNTFL